jgi:hypothetical protein
MELFEHIDVVSEGNIPSWHRFQRTTGNSKFLEKDYV